MKDTKKLPEKKMVFLKDLNSPGCGTQMEINVYVDINPVLTYTSTWRTRPDTIRSVADSEIYFYWPNDTLYSEKLGRLFYTN